MDTTITIDLPGKFDGFWDGTSLMQYGTDADLIADWGPAGVVLREAYRAAPKIVRGKGYSWRLSLPRGGGLTREAIDILRIYGESCAIANKDNAYGSGLDPEDRNDAYGEMMAGRKVEARCLAALAALDAE